MTIEGKEAIKELSAKVKQILQLPELSQRDFRDILKFSEFLERVIKNQNRILDIAPWPALEHYLTLVD